MAYGYSMIHKLFAFDVFVQLLLEIGGYLLISWWDGVYDWKNEETSLMWGWWYILNQLLGLVSILHAVLLNFLCMPSRPESRTTLGTVADWMTWFLTKNADLSFVGGCTLICIIENTPLLTISSLMQTIDFGFTISRRAHAVLDMSLVKAIVGISIITVSIIISSIVHLGESWLMEKGWHRNYVTVGGRSDRHSTCNHCMVWYIHYHQLSILDSKSTIHVILLVDGGVDAHKENEIRLHIRDGQMMLRAFGDIVGDLRDKRPGYLERDVYETH